MEFKIGDPVMHWTFGLGQVVELEERGISGEEILYYAVKVHDLTVWVPADGDLKKRLRPPTPAGRFEKLFAILTGSGSPLPDDRMDRKTQLLERLSDGRAESLCQVVHDLFIYRKGRSLNETDQYLLKRVQNALLGEWSFSFSIPVGQAETDLYRLLDSIPVPA
jgi:RNA polymerase-interacting CarD/CdnL/TRCF family regulator